MKRIDDFTNFKGDIIYSALSGGIIDRLRVRSKQTNGLIFIACYR